VRPSETRWNGGFSFVRPSADCAARSPLETLLGRGKRGHDVFRFIDPYMRPYLWMEQFQPTQTKLF
jgi:hypothetical protein